MPALPLLRHDRFFAWSVVDFVKENAPEIPIQIQLLIYECDFVYWLQLFW